MEDDENCVSCKFFLDEREEDGSGYSFCRRFPPQILKDEDLLPSVDAMTGWCGEYKENSNGS